MSETEKLAQAEVTPFHRHMERVQKWGDLTIESALELIERQAGELDLLRTGGVIEVMIRNPNVDEFARSKEAEIERLRAELQARRAADAGMREALRPFAKLADLPALQPDVADDYMPLNVGLMNGNVTQTVIRDQLRVSDLRAARAALGARND